MVRVQSRRTEVLSVLFSGSLALTESGLSLRSLVRWPPDPDQRVGNAVSFKSRYRTSVESKPLENGEGVPVSGTYVPGTGTHVSNRYWRGSVRACPRGLSTYPPRDLAHSNLR